MKNLNLPYLVQWTLLKILILRSLNNLKDQQKKIVKKSGPYKFTGIITTFIKTENVHLAH